MITRILVTGLALVLLCFKAHAQESTPPASSSDLEAAYTTAIEKRTQDIMDRLAIEDDARAERVHDTIITQYRTLRARDEAIDRMFMTHAPEAQKNEDERYAMQQCMTKPLHEHFIVKLSSDLDPGQLEIVKNRMTYDKVKVTYDAYCAIVPNLTEKDKARILEVLKEAREEAMDGGSAQQKTDIFGRHKERINQYLNAQGHDLEKAFKEWTAKQQLTSAQQAAPR